MHNIDAFEAIPETLAGRHNFVQFVLHNYDFGIDLASFRALTVQGKVSQSLGQGLVGFLELVDLTFRLTDLSQAETIGLLPSQKLTDHFLNVRYLCGVFNNFECFVNSRALFHLFFHLFAHELVPELRKEQLVAQHQLGTVFVLI